MTTKILTISFFLIFLSACSGTPSKQENELTLEKLQSHYHEWQSTPYRYGGLNKRGIDCSGFLFVTFNNLFDIKIPRTTESISQKGKKLAKQELRPGDVILFKTGKKQLHAGIYMEDNRFLHASTSKGVIISDMDNVYWKEKYWQARRYID